MSKAIQGAAELAGAAAMGGLMFLEGATGVGVALMPFEMHAMEALALGGVATEAAAIASAIGSKSGIGVTTRTPAALRQIIRGVRRVGGTIVYVSTTGSSSRQYNMIIAIAGHPCETIENLYLDGRQVFWDTSSGYNQTVGGYNFGGNADGNDHTGPNGVQYNFGGEVFCAAFYGNQNNLPTVVNGVWVGAGSSAGFCSALQANDPTWSPGSQGTPYLAGCTYVYLKLEADSGTFPQFPEIRFTVHGKNDVWDPRTQTRGFTTNWALHAADVISDPTWGLGDAVNQAQLIAAANVCDELVACAAGQEAQYSYNDAYDAGLSPGDALQRMMGAAAGRVSHIGDEWFVWPAYWQGPSFAFGENSLLDAVQWRVKRPLSQLVNRVTGTYTAPNYPYNVAGNLYDSNGFWNGQTQNNFPYSFQPTNFPMYAADVLHGYGEDVYLVADTPNSGAWVSTTAYAAGTVVIYGGVPWEALQAVAAGVTPTSANAAYWAQTGNYLPLEVTLEGVLSVSQAQRVAKIMMMRNRQQGAGKLAMGANALQLQPLDVIEQTFAPLGWNSKYLEVAGDASARLKIHFGSLPGNKSGARDEAPALWLEVPVIETDQSVYEWASTEELTPYDVPAISGGVQAFLVQPPSGLTTESDLSTAVIQPDGAVIPQIEVSWTEPADTYVTNGGTIEVQITPHGTGAWTTAKIVSGQVTAVFLSAVVVNGAYDIRIRAVRSNGAASAWVESDSIVCGYALRSSDLTSVVRGYNGTLPLLTANTSSYTASTITIQPFTATYDSNYWVYCLTAGAATLSGLTPGTFYYIYYVDSTYALDAITPVATQSATDFVGKPGYFLIGTITTPGWMASGSVIYRPTAFADDTPMAIPPVLNPSSAYDGNSSTSAVLVGGYAKGDSSKLAGSTGVWSGFQDVALGYGATLTVTLANAGTGDWGISVSLEGSTTWVSVATGSGTSTQTNYTYAIPAGTNLGEVSVQVYALQTLGGNPFVELAEISIQ